MQEHADSRTLEVIKQLLSRSKVSTKKWAEVPGTALIIAEERSLQTANGQFALCMSVNALSRLYPIFTRIGLLVPDSAYFSVDVPLFLKSKVQESLLDFVSKLKPDCRVNLVNAPHRDWDAVLSIGISKPELNNKISIASDGWVAFASTGKLSTNFTEKTNPIGAYAATCIGGMEVFKRVFMKKSNLLIPDKTPSDVRWRLKLIEGELCFSTFDYQTNQSPEHNPSLPSVIDLKNLCIAGLGAGGGAAAYALASLVDVEGRLTLIDPDEVKSSNMNRYVYALQNDVTYDWPKVEVVRELFRRFKRLCVICYPYPYQKLSESRKINTLDVMVSTVDTKETRRDIQWDMPRVILDAAVLLTEFYVRRVDLGKSPCLLCTHKSDGIVRSSEEIISDVTGLSTSEVVKLRTTNDKITQEHIERMRKSSEKYGFPLPSRGERFNDWVTMHCGELVLPLTRERFPLPFATILPGILIAGEVIKDRYFPENILQNYYSYDMISLPLSGMVQHQPFSNCILCSSQKALEVFAKKAKKAVDNSVFRPTEQAS